MSKIFLKCIDPVENVFNPCSHLFSMGGIPLLLYIHRNHVNITNLGVKVILPGPGVHRGNSEPQTQVSPCTMSDCIFEKLGLRWKPVETDRDRERQKERAGFPLFLNNKVWQLGRCSQNPTSLKPC